jgi:hypothetical protein
MISIEFLANLKYSWSAVVELNNGTELSIWHTALASSKDSIKRVISVSSDYPRFHRTVTFENVLRLYTNHEVLGVENVCLPDVGWASYPYPVKDVSAEEQIEECVKLRARVIQLKLKSKRTGDFSYPDYKTSELLK